MPCRSLVPAVLALLLGACNGEIYVRDGVTDGDTFYLAERALHDPDPALQSWVRYSLAKSVCQLELGGDNPARATSFECELTAREHLVESWVAARAEAPAPDDRYLEALRAVAQADLLPEYVWHYFKKSGWQPPSGLELARFDAWRRRHLAGHEPETHLVGSWGYAPGARAARR